MSQAAEGAKETQLMFPTARRRVLLAMALIIGVSAAVVGSTSTPAAAAPNVLIAGVSADKYLSFTTPGSQVVAVAFAPDPSTQIYAADKTGKVLMFGGKGDTSPTLVLDLRTAVHDYHDRGLLGITLDPSFGAGGGWIYILYTYDRDPFGSTTVPAWGGSAGNDNCGSQPAGDPGCVVSARLSRFQVNGAGTVTGSEQVLVQSDGTSGWCEQFPSHSIGTLAFGADGKLYAGAGEGASFGQVDYGQTALNTTNPSGVANPCNDPPGGRGVGLTQPTSEGGALRAQSARSTFADTYSPLDGTIIRINPDGTIPTDNPLRDNGVDGDDRIVAFGLRNPFRFSIKPATNELWIGDVGSGTFEEIDRFTPSSTTVPNFGWPCWEGPNANASNFGGFNFCTSFESDVTNGQIEAVGTKTIAQPTAPVLSLVHAEKAATVGVAPPPQIGCNNIAGSAVIGGSFVQSSSWPGAYQNAYVVGDYARGCLWVLPSNKQTSPQTADLVQLATGIEPVQITTGPGGDVYVVELPQNGASGSLWRFSHGPSAMLTATPTNPQVNNPVLLSAAGSTGAVPLSYTWDLNDDGSFGDATGLTTTTTFSTPGVHNVAVKVAESGTAKTSIATLAIQVGAKPVINSITSSATANGWAVGDTVTYAANVTDAHQSSLHYAWNILMKHCSPATTGNDCHEHLNVVGALPDAASGSFSAPGHEWRAILRIELTVTNSDGLSATQSLEVSARGHALSILTDPPGLQVGFVDQNGKTPFTATVTENDPIQVGLTKTQQLNGKTYLFTGWADDPAAGADRVVRLRAPTTITAHFTAISGFNPVGPVRILDTRDGTGGVTTKPGDGSVVRLQVTGANDVPAGAGSAVLNVTATEPVGPGFVTVFPCDSAQPFASNLNYGVGETVANLVQVRLAGDGSVCLFTKRAAHLIADLAGYLSDTGKRYAPADPVRVLDTREGIGAPAGKVGPAGEVALDLASRAPAGASAVVLNITATDNIFGAGYVSAYPCGGPRPVVSNVNSRLFDTRPNLAVVPLGSGGKVCLFSQSQLHLIADLAGWYVPTGSGIAAQDPLRVLDTRDNLGAPGPVSAGTSITLNLDDYAPANATAVVMNLTSVDQSDDGYVTAWPCGERPVVSNLNVLRNDTRPNLVMVRLSANRKVCLFAQRTTNLVADLAGWALE